MYVIELTLSFIILKNGLTYLKNFAVWTPFFNIMNERVVIATFLFFYRSHSFAIRKAQSEMQGKKIYNLNVRGKRGNIVQVYPAVEYDFVPNRLLASKDDYLHIQ